MLNKGTRKNVDVMYYAPPLQINKQKALTEHLLSACQFIEVQIRRIKHVLKKGTQNEA